MQMFNVQSKNRQEVSLVYCTNQTKRLMEKTKKNADKMLYNPILLSLVAFFSFPGVKLAN